MSVKNKYANRSKISDYCQLPSPFPVEVEVDESYLSAHRVKGKRGRGAQGKTIVFEIFKQVEKSTQRLFQIAKNSRYKR